MHSHRWTHSRNHPSLTVSQRNERLRQRKLQPSPKINCPGTSHRTRGLEWPTFKGQPQSAELGLREHHWRTVPLDGVRWDNKIQHDDVPDWNPLREQGEQHMFLVPGRINLFPGVTSVHMPARIQVRPRQQPMRESDTNKAVQLNRFLYQHVPQRQAQMELSEQIVRNVSRWQTRSESDDEQLWALPWTDPALESTHLPVRTLSQKHSLSSEPIQMRPLQRRLKIRSNCPKMPTHLQTLPNLQPTIRQMLHSRITQRLQMQPTLQHHPQRMLRRLRPRPSMAPLR